MPSITIRSIMEDLRAENEAMRLALERIDDAINSGWLEDLAQGQTDSRADRVSLLWIRDQARALLPKEEEHAKTE